MTRPVPCLALAAALLGGMAFAPACTPSPPPRRSPVVLVAADGASWPLLSPMLSRGELPNLARLYRAGAAGILVSSEPLSPAVVWTTVATGRPREAHGVVFDAVRAPGARSLRAVTADQRRAASLWEIASARGITVGVADWPATWPAQPVNGFMIAEGFGSETAAARGYLHPPAALGQGGEAGEDLKLPEELREAASMERAVARAFEEDLASLSRALSLQRVHQARFLMLRFRSIDAVAHGFWQYHEPRYLDLASSRGEKIDPAEAARREGAVAAACRLLDAWIGLLQERLPEDATLVVASGWGMRGVRMTDFLHVDLDALVERLGHGASRGPALFALGDTGRVPRALYLDHGAGAGDSSAVHEDPGEFLGRTAADLRALATGGGGPVFLAVNVRDQAGTGPALELLENREVDPLAKVMVAGRALEVRSLYRRYGDGYAAHDPEGLIIAAGPGISAGAGGWSAATLDVAPTLLALLGLPAAGDMPGRPIKALALEEPAPGSVPTWEGAWPLPGPARRDDADARLAIDRIEASGHLQ